MNNNNNKTPFDILGVGRFSTQKEIRRRYLELCKKHHPDINKQQVVDFREITVAYELLTNSKKNNNIIASGGQNWEEVKQKSINTRVWTRNSYIVGFAFTAGLLVYLSYDKFITKDEKRILLPHERKRQIYSTTATSDNNNDGEVVVPPWQAAGTTFREWRKK